MRILAGIPTYHRQSAPALAKQLSKYVDKVIIVPQDTELPEAPEYELIPCEKGTKNARNKILETTLLGNYDIALQCDDDFQMKDKFIEIFITCGKALFSKGISSLCGKSRLIAFWDGKGYSNKTWEIRPRMNSIFMTTASAIKITGGYDFDLFDDLDYVLRMMRKGLVPAQLSANGYTFNHVIGRHGKDESVGGYSGEFMRVALPEAIRKINEKHADLCHIEEKELGKHRIKFNWDNIRTCIPNLGLGYEDKKGIRC